MMKRTLQKFEFKSRNLAQTRPLKSEAPIKLAADEAATNDSALSAGSGAAGKSSISQLLSEQIAKLAEYTRLEDRYIQPFSAQGDALECVCRVYLKSGGEALIAGPVQSQFRTCAESCGALTRLSLASDPFVTDIYSLMQNITPATKLIYLMNPNYPSGAAWTTGDIERLLVSAPDALLIVDEAYFEFYGKTCSQLVRRYDNLIMLRRLDKAFGESASPSSYALAAPVIFERLKAAGALRSAAAAGRAGAFAAPNHVRLSTEHIRQVRENITSLALGLQRLGLETRATPTDAVLLKVSCPEKVVSFLAEKNISAADCRALPQMDNYVRITVSDNEYCAGVIQRFEEMPVTFYLEDITQPAALESARDTDNTEKK